MTDDDIDMLPVDGEQEEEDEDVEMADAEEGGWWGSGKWEWAAPSGGSAKKADGG